MVTGTRIELAFFGVGARRRATAIASKYADFRILARDVDTKPGLWLTMNETKVQEIETYAISQNLQSLRNRVNEFGVSEPLVQSLGKTRIVVDLPGVQDSADAKRILNKFANLEFRLVAKPDDRASETESYPYEGRTVVVERSNIVTGDRVTGAHRTTTRRTICLRSASRSTASAVTACTTRRKTTSAIRWRSSTRN